MALMARKKKAADADEIEQNENHRVRSTRIVYDSMRRPPQASEESLVREGDDRNAQIPFDLPSDFDVDPTPDEMTLK